MGLSPFDLLPKDTDLRTAYKRIRSWYQHNLDQAPDNDYGEKSRRLICSLPAPKSASKDDIRSTMHEVLYGLLEWGYHSDDSHFKMAAYAHVALGHSKINSP